MNSERKATQGQYKTANYFMNASEPKTVRGEVELNEKIKNRLKVVKQTRDKVTE